MKGKPSTKRCVLTAPAERETALVTTIGTSPSVLTSTIWALAKQEQLLPHRIKVLTTRLGFERLIQQVFTPASEFGGRTVWENLCENLETAGFDLQGRLEFAPSPAYIRVFTAIAPGVRVARELDDITTQSENEQVADTMLETLRGVMNDDTRLIASIAGGRKTVSALFYACVSLIGRSDDRIIHVVVNEPFDRPDLQPPFFFPSQLCAKLSHRDGKTIHACDAQVNVIDVPFVPLANLFPRELGRTPGRFSALVADYREAGQRRSLSTLRLTVCRSRTEIEVDGAPLRLGPREHLLAIFLAERVVAKGGAFASIQNLADAVEKRRLELVASIPRNDHNDWRHKLSDAILDEQDVRRALSNLRTNLRDAGQPAAKLVATLPQRGRFALALDEEQVRLVE